MSWRHASLSQRRRVSMNEQPITQTIQEGRRYSMPWMYSYKPGQRFVVEHKRAGKIVRTDAWILVSFQQAGETMRRWERCITVASE